MHRSRKKQIRALVMNVWNGDNDAYLQLYSMTCNHIYNYCRFLLKSDAGAKKALKAVYVFGLENILSLTDPALFKPWMRRIAFDICRDELTEAGDLNMNSMIDPTFLDALPFYERQILFLSDYRDVSNGDIAALLDISKSEVAKCLKNAREHLMILDENGKL